jgi:hypothetical protein
VVDDESRGGARLEGILAQLGDAVDDVRGRLVKLAEDVEIKRRLSEVVAAVDALRLEVLDRVRGGSGVDSGPVSEPEPEAHVEAEVESGSEPEPEAHVEAEVESGSEPEPEPDAHVEAEVESGSDGEGGTTPLEVMTVRQLLALAREREIPGRSSMNKAQLIAALQES